MASALPCHIPSTLVLLSDRWQITNQNDMQIMGRNCLKPEGAEHSQRNRQNDIPMRNPYEAIQDMNQSCHRPDIPSARTTLLQRLILLQGTFPSSKLMLQTRSSPTTSI